MTEISRLMKFANSGDNPTPKEGDLRIWWIPQIPGKPFHQAVSSLDEAKLVTDILARYDAFQLVNNIKGDYANAGGVQIFEDGEWCEWYDPEEGDDFRTYMSNRQAPKASE